MSSLATLENRLKLLAADCLRWANFHARQFRFSQPASQAKATPPEPSTRFTNLSHWSSL